MMRGHCAPRMYPYDALMAVVLFYPCETIMPHGGMPVESRLTCHPEYQPREIGRIIVVSA